MLKGSVRSKREAGKTLLPAPGQQKACLSQCHSFTEAFSRLHPQFPSQPAKYFTGEELKLGKNKIICFFQFT